MPKRYPKISIVTPSYNQDVFIEECILSVIEQDYPNLEYVIIDGGSNDNTLNIIKKYEKYISFWISEKDNGMYDALNRGFQNTSGELMGWINSDDIMVKKSLFALADIFSNNQNIDWVQGHPSVLNEEGSIVYQRSPRSSMYSFLNKEYHDGIFIQQESTYWRRNLWENAGAFISTKYKYAGDFELWMRFYTYAEQFITPAILGAFRMRQNQLSLVQYDNYLIECDQIIDLCLKNLSEKNKTNLRDFNNRASKVSSLINRIFGIEKDVPKPAAGIVAYDRNLQQFKILN